MMSAGLSHAFDNNMLPQELAGNIATSSQNVPQGSDQPILSNQSIVDLSPSSSMKYQTNNKMFGSQLFKGAFATSTGYTFNSNYKINPGDNIN